jgi:uncharacterized damage-inducible protein DinB
MNSIMQDYYPLFTAYQAMRKQLMELVSDEDLEYRPSEANPTLGALCVEIGETERSYIESFKRFEQDFQYRNEDPGLLNSVGQLSAWYQTLDRELVEVVGSLSDEDIQSRAIDRGGGFTVLPQAQLDIFKEALIIFYGKASVYLKAMGKTLPEQWQEWIV